MAIEKKKRILIVDDDLEFAQLIKVHLRKEPFDITVTSNVEEFFRKYLEIKPELCLIDLHINNDLKAGVKIVATIRKKIGTEVPLIVFSRENNAQIITYCMEVGANDYITKPIDPFFLLGKIKHFLNLGRLDIVYRQVPQEYKKAVITLDAKVTAMDEDGLFVRSPVCVAKGCSVNLQSEFFKTIGIEDGSLRMIVEHAVIDAQKKCELYLQFPPNSSNLNLKVRAWISAQHNNV